MGKIVKGYFGPNPYCAMCRTSISSCPEEAITVILAMLLAGYPLEQVHQDLCEKHKRLINEVVKGLKHE